MSAMAFSMYQFTKGEGALKTTQDLFTQAEYFAEEANRLYKVIRQFSYQVGGVGWVGGDSRLFDFGVFRVDLGWSLVRNGVTEACQFTLLLN